MPFKSEAPRHRLRAKSAYVHGSADALAALGLKSAAEELRLKIPDRTFHGFEAAHKAEASRANKKAEYANDANGLVAMLEALDAPGSPNTELSTRSPLDRATAWGAPSNLSAGDTASRLGDMGQSTAGGQVF